MDIYFFKVFLLILYLLIKSTCLIDISDKYFKISSLRALYIRKPCTIFFYKKNCKLLVER